MSAQLMERNGHKLQREFHPEQSPVTSFAQMGTTYKLLTGQSEGSKHGKIYQIDV
jgi:hypothetical protein